VSLRLFQVMLAKYAAEAFPPGVMNIMTGGDELGQLMVEHPKIAQISFTGSAATGKKIMATGAATLKKVCALRSMQSSDQGAPG
jgi:acyl-CoA reductase-like NAD-dependent aldehyde dehydrogenase